MNNTTIETTYIRNRDLYDIFVYIINGLIMLFFGLMQYQMKKYFKKTDTSINQLKSDVESLSMATTERNNNRTSINEPYYEGNEHTHRSQDLTHRDFELPNGNILRIHK